MDDLPSVVGWRQVQLMVWWAPPDSAVARYQAAQRRSDAAQTTSQEQPARTGAPSTPFGTWGSGPVTVAEFHDFWGED